MIQPSERHLITALVLGEFEGSEVPARELFRFFLSHPSANVIANLYFQMKAHLGVHPTLPCVPSHPSQPLHSETPIPACRELTRSPHTSVSSSPALPRAGLGPIL